MAETGWPDRFRQALRSTGELALVWRIVPVKLRTEATYRGDDYVLSTSDRYGYGSGTLRGPPRTSGTRVAVQSWTSTVGGYTFEIVGGLAELRGRFTRGTSVQVQCGVFGDGLDDFATIAFGAVTAIGSSAGVCTIEISDPLQLLDGRLVDEGDAVVLFDDLAEDRGSSALTADYTAGDATVNVGSTADFTPGESGVDQVILVGSDSYLKYTGKTGTTFTGCSAGVYGTTAKDCAAGIYVRELNKINGHPIDLVRKIITSRDGSNGAFDELPAGWALGLDHTVLDNVDASTERDTIATIGAAYVAVLLVEAPVDAPRAWMEALLSAFGCVFTARQGRITIRAATMDATRRRAPVAELSHLDLVAGASHGIEWHDRNIAREYGSLVVTHRGGSYTHGADTLGSLPGADAAYQDVAPYIFVNETEIIEEIGDRLDRFYTQVPEALTLEVAGLWAAELAPLDCVTLTLGIDLGTRLDYSEGRDVLVVQVAPDWQRGRVTLRVLAYPEEGDEWA